MRIDLGRPRSRSRAEALTWRALRWELPELPGLTEDTPRRWEDDVAWRPPGTGGAVSSDARWSVATLVDPARRSAAMSVRTVKTEGPSASGPKAFGPAWTRTMSSRDATQRVHIAGMVVERVGCL